MKRKVRGYQPVLSDTLENRTVLSGLGGFIPTLPLQDAQAVAKDVTTFEKSYNADVQNILVPKGTTNPAANRTAFNAQVATDLGTLNSAIDTSIANIVSSNPSLAATIQADLLTALTPTGSSLQEQLAAVKTPTSGAHVSVLSFVSKSDWAIDQADYTVTKLVSSATPPTGTITPDSVKPLFQAVNSAFQTFQKDYASAVSASATNPSTNRTAFNTAVQGLLTTLNSSIASALSVANLPAGFPLATLQTTVTNDLTGTPATGKSLQARLAAIKSPSSSRGFSMWVFQAQSLGTISLGWTHVTSDIASAINTYNASL
jgi:hypothetical protein